MQLPEPGRFWIRYTPRGWPEPPGPWSNLAAGCLAWGRSASGAIAAGPDPLDDLLYLPPVPAELAGPAPTGKPAAESGLIAFMLTGIFWGAVSLVTPCVDPLKSSR